MDLAEKRSFVRIEIDNNQVYNIQIGNKRGEKVAVKVKDISLSGMGVEFKSDTITMGGSTGELITIKFTRKGETEPDLVLSGTIRWKNMLPQDRILFGIEFSKPTDEMKSKILEVIDTLL